jgi:uncharacterized membrane protein
VNDPARVFAAIAIGAGLVFAVVMPPGAAPDETRHLSRVFLISEGFLAVPGAARRAEVPKSIPELHRSLETRRWPEPPERRSAAEIASYLDQPLDPDRRAGIANAGTYPPFVYLPQLPGVLIGRWLELSPAALIYLGRATSLLVWVAATALAIRLAPARRWALVLLSLTPMAVAGAASISADPMTLAMALLFTAVTLRAAGGSGPLARGERIAIVAAALAVSQGKPGYWPLALLALALPQARFDGRARWLAFAAVVAAATTLPSLAWIAHAQASAPALPVQGSDPGGQAAFVLGDPLGFAAVLIRTVRVFAASWYTTYVGELGTLAVTLPAVVYLAWGAAFTAALAADGPPLATSRVWPVAAFASSAVAVLGLAYLGWNAVGKEVVAGVQGRYFAPAVPALVLALPAWRRSLPPGLRTALVSAAAAILLVAVAAAIAVYYRL